MLDQAEPEQCIRLEEAWIALNAGRVLDPVNIWMQVDGAVIWGLGHATNCLLTFAGHGSERRNSDRHAWMRLHQCPRFHVRVSETDPRMRGAGQTGTSLAAPALAKVIFAVKARLPEMPCGWFIHVV